MLHKELHNPQGKTVARNMHNLNIEGVDTVRVGKRVEMVIEANDADAGTEKVETACRKLLANVIMETYSFDIEAV